MAKFAKHEEMLSKLSDQEASERLYLTNLLISANLKNSSLSPYKKNNKKSQFQKKINI